MREIKFRAWDTYTKQMICTGFHVIGEVAMCNALSGFAHAHPKEGVNWLIRLNDITLMQYTGLKDKDGKEVYEGDVIAFDGEAQGEEEYGVVKFYRGCFGYDLYVKGDPDIQGIYTGCLTGWIKEEPEDSIEIEHCVIGNIYENEEVLNGRSEV